jgi:ketosteroid isomerase-like protein
MSHFHGWPEHQVYEGVEEAQRFLAEWTSAWNDWEIRLEELIDAGDRVVSLMRQRGRSKLTGIVTDMSLAMVWTFRDGKETRMDMYSDVGDTREAVGHGR